MEDRTKLEVGAVYQKRGNPTGERFVCICTETEASGRVRGLFHTLSHGLLPLEALVEMGQYDRVDDLPHLREQVAWLTERVEKLETRRG